MTEATSMQLVWIATCLQEADEEDINASSEVNTWLYGCRITDSRVKVLAPRKSNFSLLICKFYKYAKLVRLKHNNCMLGECLCQYGLTFRGAFI
jgi:hypothetical protein